jgi:hypothetical protein
MCSAEASSWVTRSNTITISGAGIDIFDTDISKIVGTSVGEDASGVLVGSTSGGFSGVGELVEFDIFSYADISFNAEMSNSLSVDSSLSIGFVTCAAVNNAFSSLFNIWG